MAKDEEQMREPSTKRATREAHRQQPDDHRGGETFDPGADKEEWIGRQLRKVYDETLSEPVPDRLLALLKKLKSEDPDAS